MATLPDSTPSSALQPDLRAYIVYDKLPAGCIAHIVTEGTCPFIRAGETVVVDTNDREIATGDLFLMESGRQRSAGPVRNIVEFRQRTHRIGGADGKFRDTLCWTALFYSVMVSFDGSSRQAIRLTDGPVKVSSPAYLSDRIIGRVVGLYESTFAEPLKLEARHG